MTIKYFLAAALLAAPAFMMAKPADPRVRQMTNPDGSIVEIRVMGDEYFSFYTDADRTCILERDSKGFFVPAVREGIELKLNEANVALLREEMEAAPGNTMRKAPMERMAALDSSGRSEYPTIGEGNRSLVLLVEFADTKFTMDDPKKFYDRQLNEPGFSDYGAKGSAIDYYTAISNGKYKPHFDVYGPVTVSRNAEYYDNKSGNLVMGDFVYEAIKNLNETGEIDFSNYDFDGDGIVDTVFFYYAGHGQADSDYTTIWPHQSDYTYFTYSGFPTLRFNGKKIGPYACGNELKGYNPTGGKEPWVDGIGTFVHEYGHVLGLPDMYNANYDGTVHPGEWDVMASGCYNGYGCVPPLFSAYEQWVCHWLDYTTAESGTHYDLAALGTSDTPSAVRVRIPMSSSGTTFQPEYFIIEARDKNVLWDSCFPHSGLMAWRIHYKKAEWVNNEVNVYNNPNVEIITAVNMKNPIFTPGTTIYSGGDAEFVPSKNYTYWESPIITGIDYDPENKIGSFDYNMVAPPEMATVLHDAPLAFEDGSRSFTLQWDPVEGVDKYLLTVRTTTNGKIIGGFDATDVGTATSAVVTNLSSMYWKLEMEAFVSCVANGMVSTKTSNVIKFKPSELEKGSGVEGIENDSTLISGGNGCVIAPEYAEVYSVTGQRMGRENLVAGVYIVKCGNITRKVYVK